MLEYAKRERNLWANVIARNVAEGRDSAPETLTRWTDYANRVDDARLMLREVHR